MSYYRISIDFENENWKTLEGRWLQEKLHTLFNYEGIPASIDDTFEIYLDDKHVKYIEDKYKIKFVKVDISDRLYVIEELSKLISKIGKEVDDSKPYTDILMDTLYKIYSNKK